MSSIAPSSTFSASQPSQSSNDSTPVNNTGKLYLYTFLATLLLLLAISAVIVARSLVLRRRHQHFMTQAIAAGTWPPPRKKKRHVGQKPKLYDAWVARCQEERLEWEQLKPLSVVKVRSHTKSTPLVPNASSTSASSQSPTSPISRIANGGLGRLRLRSSRNARQTPASDEATIIDSQPVIVQDKAGLDIAGASPPLSPVDISFFIAMPCANPIPYDADALEMDEPEAPLVELGIIRMNVPDSGSAAMLPGTTPVNTDGLRTPNVTTV